MPNDSPLYSLLAMAVVAVVVVIAFGGWRRK